MDELALVQKSPITQQIIIAPSVPKVPRLGIPPIARFNRIQNTSASPAKPATTVQPQQTLLFNPSNTPVVAQMEEAASQPQKADTSNPAMELFAQYCAFSEKLQDFWENKGPNPGAPPSGYDAYQKTDQRLYPLFNPFWKQQDAVPEHKSQVRDDDDRPLHKRHHRHNPLFSAPQRSLRRRWNRHTNNRDDDFAEQFGRMLERRKSRLTGEKIIDLAEKMMHDQNLLMSTVT
jgi:hypothetical protein